MDTKPPISRVQRSKAEAQASYDRMSAWYDTLAGASERKYKEMGLQLLDVRRGERVLEIGSGTGHCLVSLAHAAGRGGYVCGLDLSTGMLRAARRTIQASGSAANVHLVCGDGARLPYGGASFAAVFMSFTLELFDTPEIPLVLDECRRVLRPDGRLGVVAMSKNETKSPVMDVYEWAHAHFTRYVDCRPIYVQDALENAGFAVVIKREMSMFGLPVEIVVAQRLAPVRAR